MTFSREFAARTLVGEAASEPLDGRIAVAHSFVNRFKKADAWYSGKTLGQICHRHAQFSCWNDGDVNCAKLFLLAEDDPALLDARAIVAAAAADDAQDPTGGATHYYREGTPTPAWVAGNPAQGIPPATFTGKHGHHLFYRDVR